MAPLLTKRITRFLEARGQYDASGRRTAAKFRLTKVPGAGNKLDNEGGPHLRRPPSESYIMNRESGWRAEQQQQQTFL